MVPICRQRKTVYQKNLSSSPSEENQGSIEKLYKSKDQISTNLQSFSMANSDTLPLLFSVILWLNSDMD